MTKAELVDELSRVSGVPKADAEKIVETVFERMAEALANGDTIELRGFGSFHIRTRRPRTGRNPKTGATVEVPAKRAPLFRAGKEIRAILAGKAPPRL